MALASFGGPVDVMEIGGGTGAFYVRVKNNARTYINIEPGRIPLSGKALERLKDPRYVCLKCSAEQIPLPDESVDVILSIASLDHVPDYRKALSEVSRLLRKGGIFILTLNNRRSWWKVMLSRTAYLKRREEEIAREHYFQWSFSECESHLAEFIPVRHIYTTTFVPFIPTCGGPYCPYLISSAGSFVVTTVQTLSPCVRSRGWMDQMKRLANSTPLSIWSLRTS